MIEWILIIDMHYTSQQLVMSSAAVCQRAATEIRKTVDYVYCINKKTGEVLRGE